MLSRKSPIMVYCKPDCIFCSRTKDFFSYKHIPYNIVNLDPTNDTYKFDVIGLKKLAKTSHLPNHMTFPWIFVGDKFVGGYSDLLHVVSTGNFKEMVAKHDIKFDDDDF